MKDVALKSEETNGKYGMKIERDIVEDKTF